MTRLKLNPDFKHKYIEFPFYKDGVPFGAGSPSWGMTLLSAGSMRFRWNEDNPARKKLLSEIAAGGSSSGKMNIVPVELMHSKTVFDVREVQDTAGKNGDGIITARYDVMPVVTVADCMPLYFWDFVRGVKGIVHSGWKGTGIAGTAVRLMHKNYGSSPQDICVAVGAHIRSCCYIVGEERAEYFKRNFCTDCVEMLAEGKRDCAGAAVNWNTGGGREYRLSLEKANLLVLEECGIPDENITVLDECTCCNTLFGSNRRETAGGNPAFTVQAAFVR